MLKITNNILDQIVPICFTDEEKTILEISVKGQVLSNITHQFLYYYDGYCYRHDIERLKSDIAYIKEENIDLLERIKGIKETIIALSNPYKYNKSILRDSLNKSEYDSTSISKNTSDTDSTHTETTLNLDNEINLANETGQGATSQTNSTGASEEILKTVEVQKEKSTRKKLVFNADNTYRTTDEEVPEQITTKIGKANVTLPYTNSTITQDITLINNDSYTETNNAYRDKGINKELNTNLSMGSKKNNSQASTLINTENENRIKLLNLEIPKLRQKFFRAFSPIFYNAGLR